MGCVVEFCRNALLQLQVSSAVRWLRRRRGSEEASLAEADDVGRLLFPGIVILRDVMLGC